MLDPRKSESMEMMPKQCFAETKIRSVADAGWPRRSKNGRAAIVVKSEVVGSVSGLGSRGVLKLRWGRGE